MIAVQPSENLAEQPDASDLHHQVSKSGALRCPHCRCIGHRRSSREITPTYREIHYQCSYVMCGHTWRASEIYEWGLTPSAIPDPKVDLPLRVPARQAAMELLRTPDPAQPELFAAPQPDAASPSDFEPPG